MIFLADKQKQTALFLTHIISSCMCPVGQNKQGLAPVKTMNNKIARNKVKHVMWLYISKGLFDGSQCDVTSLCSHVGSQRHALVIT